MNKLEEDVECIAGIERTSSPLFVKNESSVGIDFQLRRESRAWRVRTRHTQLADRIVECIGSGVSGGGRRGFDLDPSDEKNNINATSNVGVYSMGLSVGL